MEEGGDQTYEENKLLPLSKELVDERLPRRIVQDFIRPDLLHLRQMHLGRKEENRREYRDQKCSGPWFSPMN